MTDAQKLQEALEEKRHQDLTDGNRDIVDALKKIVKDEEKEGVFYQELLKKITEQGVKIGEFAEAVKTIPQPEVNVNVNQEKLLLLLTELSESILEGQSTLINGVESLVIKANELREWDFIINKELGPQGRITNVKAKQIR